MATSPSARKNMSRVWLRMAGTSEATKYSPSPSPMTTGGPGTRGHDLVRIGAGNHAQREYARQFLHGFADGVLQIAFVILFHQMRDHFGVRLGDELVPFELELMLQLQIILDDAVVHHDDVAGAIPVRVRVLFGGTPVRGPARVADAVRPIQRIHADRVFQISQFARRRAGSPDDYRR